MDELKILVVEDDPDGQEVVARMLKHHNIPVDIANHAEEGIEFLEANSYSAAIIDLALPGMDGWGLLKAIQGDPETTDMPCIAITAYHSADVAVEAIAAGFKAYFPKPLEATSFVRELQRILA